MIPQIIYLVLSFAGLLWAAHKHGQRKDGNHDFWIALVGTTLVLTLLYYGGFFDPILK